MLCASRASLLPGLALGQPGTLPACHCLLHITHMLSTYSLFCLGYYTTLCLTLLFFNSQIIWGSQVSVLKRVAFARKQRAIRDAVRIGDQIIRRNRRMLLASTFNAWKLRAGVYRQVARRFQAALEVTLRWAWGQWRAQLATQV